VDICQALYTMILPYNSSCFQPITQNRYISDANLKKINKIGSWLNVTLDTL